MLVGVISDVHGNLEALQSVLDDMPDVDKVLCAGDIVGYGPSPRECVRVVKDVCDMLIRGNHDNCILTGQMYNSKTARAGLEHANKQLYEEDYDWLYSISTQLVTDDMQVVHSHPDPQSISHVHESEIENEFSPYFVRDIFVYGHTHIPVVTTVDDTLVLNPGSVGQPRDGDSRSSYGVLDTDSKMAEIHRVEYDINKTIDRMQKHRFPEESCQRLRKGN